MASTTGLKESDQLDGASNFTPWRYTLQMLLKELDLWEIVEGKATIPIDVALWAQYNKNVVKAKRIIIDSMKDHLILHITRKTTYEMHVMLTSLYQSVNMSKKLFLKNQHTHPT
jgi:hypothetical protein